MNTKSTVTLIAAALIIAGGLFFSMRGPALAPTVSAPDKTSEGQVALFVNSDPAFSIEYPQDWGKDQGHNATIVEFIDPAYPPVAETDKPYNSVQINGAPQDCKSSDWGSGLDAGFSTRKTICVPELEIAIVMTASSVEAKAKEEAIAASLKAVKLNSTPEDVQKNIENAAPRIDSIAPALARIGDSVVIRGQGFSGFEGDRYAWIENAAGKKGIIYGDLVDKNDPRAATDNLIRFTLGSKYCTADTSYSGLPCPSYMDIVPGAYKIFVRPWGTTSAPVDFAVVE